MKVSFPAMRGVIGKKQYFATMMALSEIPHLFKFNDWQQFTPELRAQRVLVKARDTRDREVHRGQRRQLSLLVHHRCLQHRGKVQALSRTVPILATCEMDLEDAKFLINDGQHRCAAITAALNENPGIGKEKISVLLFPLGKPGACAADVH